MVYLKIALILALAYAVSTLNLPSSITICKKSDTNCISTAFREAIKFFAKGNKEYGVIKFAPLQLKEVHIPGNGGSIDLEQTYVDTYLHGFDTLELKSISIKISDSECTINFDTKPDYLAMIGTYTAKGKMLLFNINGGGSSNLTLVNPGLKIDSSCEVQEKGGEKHLKIKSFTMTLSGKLLLDYTNLVNNNPQLSETVLAAMNESNDDVFKFLKKDYEKVFADGSRVAVQAIFDAVPINKLFLD